MLCILKAVRNFWDYLFKEWLRQVGEALLLAFLVTTFIFTTVGVVGNSMNPLNGGALPAGSVSLQNGERVFVPKYETWLVRFGLTQWRRGEIAIIKPPEGTPNAVAQFPILGFQFKAFFIKRIVGVPGDEVSIREGQLVLNGQPIKETHITSLITPYPDNFPGACYRDGRLSHIIMQQGTPFAVDELPDYLKDLPGMMMPPSSNDPAYPSPPLELQGERCVVGTLKIAPDHYFVMGDNRTIGGSEDSRTFGPIAKDRIAGRSNAVWWPPISRDEAGNTRLNIRSLPIPPAFRQP